MKLSISKKYKIIILLFLLLILIIGVLFGINTYKLYLSIREIKSEAKLVETELINFDFTNLNQTLVKLTDNLDQTQIRQNKFPLKFVAKQLGLTNLVLQANSLIGTYQKTLEQTLVNHQIYQKSNLEEGINFLAKLGKNLDPKQELISTQIENIKLNLAEHQLLKSQIGKYIPLEDINLLLPANKMLTLLPRILGINSPNSVLVFLQNETEYRPSGGFWGSFITTELNKAKFSKIVSVDTGSLSKLPTIPAEFPKDIKQLIGKDLLFYHINGYPDFVSSAEIGENYLTSQFDKNFDLAIGIDLAAVKSFLKITGPIEYQGVNITPDNFINIFVYDPYSSDVKDRELFKNIKDITARKRSLSEFSQILLEKIISTPLTKIINFMPDIKKLFQAKDLMIVSTNDADQAILESLNLSGKIKTSSNNFFSLSELNASGKTSLFLTKKVEYQINQNGNLTIKVIYDYDPKKEGDKLVRNIIDFMPRLLLPAGSELVSLTGGKNQPIIDAISSKTAISTSLTMQPKTQSTINFEVKLPKLETFPLEIWKAPGSPTYDFKLFNLDITKEVRVDQDRVLTLN